MPAGELSAYYPTASLSTIYFVVARNPGKCWNGTAFENLLAANWATYAISGTDTGATRLYSAVFPTGIAAGYCDVYAYLKGGSTPAVSDLLIGSGANLYWDGTHLGYAASSGSGPVTFADGSISQATFADDMRVDGTFSASSSSTQVHFDAADAYANAISGTLNPPQYVQVKGGPGQGAMVPIGSISGGSGSKVGTVLAGYTISTTLTTSSTYQWTGLPATTAVDAASVSDAVWNATGKLGDGSKPAWKTLSKAIGRLIGRIIDDGSVATFKTADDTATAYTQPYDGGDRSAHTPGSGL